MSFAFRPNASAIAATLSATGRVRSILPFARGPTAIRRMYMSGRRSSDPGGPTAIIDIAPLPPRATTPRPSSGSTARSNDSPPAPTSVPDVEMVLRRRSRSARRSAAPRAPPASPPRPTPRPRPDRPARASAPRRAPPTRSPGQRARTRHVAPLLFGVRRLAPRLAHRAAFCAARSACSSTSPITAPTAS